MSKLSGMYNDQLKLSNKYKRFNISTKLLKLLNKLSYKFKERYKFKLLKKCKRLSKYQNLLRLLKKLKLSDKFKKLYKYQSLLRLLRKLKLFRKYILRFNELFRLSNIYRFPYK